MKITLQQLKTKLPDIMEYHEPRVLKLAEDSKQFDRLENSRKQSKLLLEKIRQLLY